MGSLSIHSVDGFRSPVANYHPLFLREPSLLLAHTLTCRQAGRQGHRHKAGGTSWGGYRPGYWPLLTWASSLDRSTNWTWYSTDHLHQAFNSKVASSCHINWLFLEGDKTVPEFSLIFFMSLSWRYELLAWKLLAIISSENKRGKLFFSIFVK